MFLQKKLNTIAPIQESLNEEPLIEEPLIEEPLIQEPLIQEAPVRLTTSKESKKILFN